MLLYFDTCCLNRPHDDQRQDRILQETQAVLSLLEGVSQGSWDMTSSEVLAYEINQISDSTRRFAVLRFLELATAFQPLSPEVETRAESLQKDGFKPFDALHLASAEAVKACVLLTTDDRFLRAAQRQAAALHVKVANPSKMVIFDP